MKKLLNITLFGVISAVSLSGEANAQMYHDTHKNWHVYTTEDQGNKVCYITSQPTSKTGNYKRRGKPYMIVTHRNAKPDEISLSSGYPYKNHSNVDLNIDGTVDIALFTTAEYPRIAWARTGAEDEKIVKLMKRGTRLTAKGYSRLGTHSVDTYSLMGFTKAYQQMKALCKR